MTRGLRSRWTAMACSPLVAAGLLSSGGCATAHLDGARHTFYQGHPGQAAQQLDRNDPQGKDEVLILMERGMAHQASGDYEASSRDLLRAIARAEELETYSLSKGGATWVVNDTMQNFRGKPYERTLLHTFAALNFLALGQWEGAAVEARRLNETLTPDTRGDYPDEPFSRYLAAVCFEMIGDRDGAAFQYRQLKKLAPGLAIDTRSGRMGTDEPAAEDLTHELIVFFLAGRGAVGSQMVSSGFTGQADAPLYAEIHAEGRILGKSRTLSDTWHLAAVTEQEIAVRKAAKTTARVAAKEAVAQSLSHSDQDELADLIRVVLIGLLEQPDLRSWRTLPRWLQVARVPCPAELDQYEIVIKTRSGGEVARRVVDQPIQGRGRTYVSFHRDLMR